MSITVQYILVSILVAGALVWMIVKLRRFAKGKGSACSGCPSAGCCNKAMNDSPAKGCCDEECCK